MKKKYLQFGVLLLLCVVLDQWTKSVASDRLATTHSWIDHPITLVVAAADAGKSVQEVLAVEFERNDAAQVEEISRRYVWLKDGTRLKPDSTLKAGDVLRIKYRKVTVVPEYFEFEYTRNQGAAFGILSDSESPFRLPFFILVSLIAVGVIVFMLRSVDDRDQLSIWALSLIAGGAIGNFIDRVSYGWVIDFIVWKNTDEFRWPTFNVADAFISVGVALLVIEMLLESRGRRAAEQGTED